MAAPKPIVSQLTSTLVKTQTTLSDPNKATADKTQISFAHPKLTVYEPLAFNTVFPPIESTIFMHPPKTAGSSFVNVVRAIERTKMDGSYKTFRFGVPPRTKHSPNRISDDKQGGVWQGGLQTANEKLNENPNFIEEANQFKFQFLSGHFPYGLHTRIQKPIQYIVLVANPIEREISCLNFDFQRGFVEATEAETYLETALDNPQTRMIAGPDYMSSKIRCDATVLEKAKQNIQKHFLLAGVKDDADTFLRVFISMQGWGPLAACRAQVTGTKVITSTDPRLPALQALLAEKHSIDLQLYAWIKKRWEEWKAQHIKTPSITEKPKEAAIKSSPAGANDTKTNTEQQLLCVLPDFATVHQPKFMTRTEIEAYNKSVSDDLVEVTQNIFAKTIEQTINKVNTNKDLETSSNPAITFAKDLATTKTVVPQSGTASASTISSAQTYGNASL